MIDKWRVSEAMNRPRQFHVDQWSKHLIEYCCFQSITVKFCCNYYSVVFVFSFSLCGKTQWKLWCSIFKDKFWFWWRSDLIRAAQLSLEIHPFAVALSLNRHDFCCNDLIQRQVRFVTVTFKPSKRPVRRCQFQTFELTLKSRLTSSVPISI
jgi:hypothetical protein